jgi:NAD(P)-dependent dehydrogenase (short-subunit alcohol dehydrogenase family)
MNKDEKIYVAGHRGLVGSAIVRALSGAGYENIVVATSRELDLKEQAAVRHFLPSGISLKQNGRIMFFWLQPGLAGSWPTTVSRLILFTRIS